MITLYTFIEFKINGPRNEFYQSGYMIGIGVIDMWILYGLDKWAF